MNCIRRKRIKAGYTQFRFAAEAKITRQFLGRIESGAAMPTVSVAQRIAAVLGVTIDELWLKGSQNDSEIEKVGEIPKSEKGSEKGEDHCTIED